MQNLNMPPGFAFDIKRVGNENTPVIVIDNALDGYAGLVNLACGDYEFRTESISSYPGIKAPLPSTVADVVLQAVTPLLYRQYRIPAFLRLSCIDQVFSLVTTPPESLGVLQRVPHFDNHDPFAFALLLYLSDNAFGGTGFFRHRPTGFERISPARSGQYIEAAKQHMREFGPPPPEYMNGSNEHYELVEHVEYRANRLVIYPGNLLHSGLIDPARDINANPATGRLTANLFVEFK